MDILNVLKRLRDDLRAWVTNNLNALDAKIDNLTGAEAVGPLDDLCTTDKSSVVAAINEVASNIDNTLSIPGAAADAKAVGDALDDKLDKTGGMISGHLDMTGGLHVKGVSYFSSFHIVGSDMHPVVGMRDGGWVGNPEDGDIGVLYCHTETDVLQPIIIRGITNPIQTDDVANKAYVDDAISEVKEGLSEFIVAESEDWKVVDSAGNIIFSVGTDGAKTTHLVVDTLVVGGTSVEEMITAKVNEAIANIYAQTQAEGTN